MTSQAGDTVTLPCQSSLNTDVDWRHQDTPTSPVYYVYTNGVVYDIFLPRFSVDRRPNQGQYDLVISRVQSSDAGLYICIDDAGLGEQLFIYELYVLSGTCIFALSIFRSKVIRHNVIFKTCLSVTLCIVALGSV